jgi:hypothetical protein
MKALVIRAAGLAVIVTATACSGSPITPRPTEPSALSGALTLSGRVVSNPTQNAIPGTKIDVVQGAFGTFTSDGSGQFIITGLSSGRVELTASAPGYLPHKTYVDLTASRSTFVLDLISDSTPFDLQFYREFARGSFDGPIRATRPWSMNPSFYFQTLTSDTGEPVRPDVLAAIEQLFVNSVPELTGGRLRAASFERGMELRTAPGWINVHFYQGQIPGTSDLGGDSTVGGNWGQIRIRSNPELDSLIAGSECSSFAARVADHEIVHALGFWHSSDNLKDFSSGPRCSGTGRPSRVPFHAAIAYSRPAGNTDVDNDPPSFAHLLSSRPEAAVYASCGLKHFVKQ